MIVEQEDKTIVLRLPSATTAMLIIPIETIALVIPIRSTINLCSPEISSNNNSTNQLAPFKH